MGKKNVPLVLASIICVVSIVVMVAVLSLPSENTEPTVFTPPPFDKNAVQGVPDVPDGLGWNELDVYVYKALICGVVVVDGSSADIWFTNPVENAVWLKLRILDADGNTIGETGIIKPGEYIQSVNFTTVPSCGSEIDLKLMGYEPETYCSAGSTTLNTTIQGGNSQ